MLGAKPFHIWFDKINGFIGVYDRARCLVFARTEKKNDFIYNKTRYLIRIKNGVTFIICDN